MGRWRFPPKRVKEVSNVKTLWPRILLRPKLPLRGLKFKWGILGYSQMVAWVGNKPYELEYLRENEIKMKLDGTFPNIDSVDKFPRYLQHIIPADNTRILDSAKVRMGAQPFSRNNCNAWGKLYKL